MNGFEVLKAIRQVSDVPVLMLTARRCPARGEASFARPAGMTCASALC